MLPFFIFTVDVVGSHTARTPMQTSAPIENGYQYFLLPWSTWQPGYQHWDAPTTQLGASSVQCPATTPQDLGFVHSLPQLQEPSVEVLSQKTASRGLPKLLPAFAKGSVTTCTPIVVSELGDKWLAKLLSRLKKIRRPSDKTAEHHNILANLLSGGEAIWSLASIMLLAAPDDDRLDDTDLLVQLHAATEVAHVIRGKVVYVDLVNCQEVCFKLIDETIEALLHYHDRVHCKNLMMSAITYDDIDARLEKAKNQYHQAIHAFTFRTKKECLEGMQDRGSGKLRVGYSKEAKSAIMALFKPLPEAPAPSEDVNTSLLVTQTCSRPNASAFADDEGGDLDASWSRLMGD